MGNSAGPLRIASTARVSWAAATKPAGADSLGLEFDMPAGTKAGACGVEVEVRVSREAGAQAASKDSMQEARISSVLRRDVQVLTGQAAPGSTLGDVEGGLRKLLSVSAVELTVATWGG